MIDCTGWLFQDGALMLLQLWSQQEAGTLLMLMASSPFDPSGAHRVAQHKHQVHSVFGWYLKTSRTLAGSRCLLPAISWVAARQKFSCCDCQDWNGKRARLLKLQHRISGNMQKPGWAVSENMNLASQKLSPPAGDGSYKLGYGDFRSQRVYLPARMWTLRYVLIVQPSWFRRGTFQRPRLDLVASGY